ncbi:restriction endonuclease subunit S [Clostridium paraputrificum]|uniref:restriction endonuclease subunit S n=1 Tax=Clostridium paraputrificum TaxID=29363 RepID=UPI00232DC504|nr:restriction endonuclease subunit S [Clostridium paraputrificum]MDB2105601.1 restriction endonuclease subunit S [Clostridium paraputrificum]MDB2112158.1 restriction endonuclease subunit S [Clostridium paraputrificum]
MKVKLNEIFEKPISGEWGTELEDGQNGVNVIRTTNFTNLGRLYLEDVVQRKIDIDKYKNKILKYGDIIIEKSGGSPSQPVGRVVIFEENDEIYFCNNFTSILRPTKLINSKYSLYLMKDLYKKGKVLKYQNKTTGIINLKLADYLNNIDVILPTINNQIKIANVLDKSQELIDKRKEQIEALDELVKSKFIEMFGDVITNSKGWETELLGEICDLKAGKNIKAKDIYEESTDGLYPCYGGNGLRGYVKNYSHEGNINLIGRQGALCGNVKYAKGKFYATEHAVVTQPKVEINSYWLHFVLRELDLNRLSTGAAQPGLTVGKLNEVKIPKIPMELQNQFSDFVKQVDKLKFEMEKSLKELEDSFNSLMQRAFNGELF